MSADDANDPFEGIDSTEDLRDAVEEMLEEGDEEFTDDPIVQLTSELREVAGQVSDLIAQVESLRCQELEPEELADVGQVLWDLSTKTTNSLKPLKKALRKIAIDRWGHGPGPRHFVGYQGGECVVTVPHPSLRVRPGADMEKLKAMIGEVAFGDHFDTTYKPRKSFRDRVASCSDKGQQTSLLGVVDEVEGTPRVSFKVR
jgi:hypothetical protein